ncbi:MAG: MBL fold metallo-hydrolase [Candidatus Pacearchaeota archaeon]
MKVGDIEITFLGHSGFLITGLSGLKIVIDPFNIKKNFKADIILITHSHYDHCSLADIEKLVKDNTKLVIPINASSKLNKIKNSDKLKVNVVKPGIKLKVDEVPIYSFPAYNVNKSNHPIEEGWMGYIIKLGDVTIYHAGDTDLIPEMSNLEYVKEDSKIFIMMLPVSGGPVMDLNQAFELVSKIKPTIAIPMHYGEILGTVDDAFKFKELCESKGIRCEVLEKCE